MSRSPVIPAIRQVRRMVPANLFGRTLLIMLVPIVVLQLTMAEVFYARHWESVVRNISSAMASEVHVLLKEYRLRSAHDAPEQALQHITDTARTMAIYVAFAPEGTRVVDGQGAAQFPDFYASLDRRIEEPFMLRSTESGRAIRVSIDVGNRVLNVTFSKKRLASSTTYIFILWMLGSSLLLVLIAGMFLRNQIRPIVQLAQAAERFGLGQTMQHFAPRGASEVRRAGRAFLVMAERIRRQVASRTEMLAGISHDLRTPLTRMQLEIEMGKIDPTTRQALVADIEEMRHMIDEYLDFARGDAAEPMELAALDVLVASLVEQYKKQGADIAITESVAITMMLRPLALRRALANLIDNALRYGQQARIVVDQSVAYARIKISDAGNGIPEAEQETVFKPFTRLEPSRNNKTGGVGLGLSIARDIAQNHGGDVTLENRRDDDGHIQGLEVTLRLPREVQSEA